MDHHVHGQNSPRTSELPTAKLMYRYIEHVRNLLDIADDRVQIDVFRGCVQEDADAFHEERHRANQNNDHDDQRANGIRQASEWFVLWPMLDDERSDDHDDAAKRVPSHV